MRILTVPRENLDALIGWLSGHKLQPISFDVCLKFSGLLVSTRYYPGVSLAQWLCNPSLLGWAIHKLLSAKMEKRAFLFSLGMFMSRNQCPLPGYLVWMVGSYWMRAGSLTLHLPSSTRALLQFVSLSLVCPRPCVFFTLSCFAPVTSHVMSAKGHVTCQIACAKDQCCSMLYAPSTQNMSINVKVKKNGAKATGGKKVPAVLLYWLQ